MKPEFFKPFNLEHARAGAPIAIRHGDEAFLVAYVPEAVSQSRVIVRFKTGEIGTRRENGKHYEGGEQAPGDLVMLPLGLIDGKPVFMGDRLVTRYCDEFTVEAKHINCLADDNTWPAPPRVYPVTLMAAAELDAAWAGTEGLRRVANTALRHAIDAGQLIEPGDRAARDMAVAVAVRNIAQSARPVARDHELSEDASELVARIAQLDLAVIIAAIN